eukprot:TRINITY_DN2604_c0_g4_i2.p1 TRINITY_DN2604_c0_g4~~TRINITY_DN2604_c0_g4_i2.p1  ORF type:complete len:181 (+),score=32.43 TRINITY_DN2604_c0_g4_i2:180-722(+)
MTQGLFQRGEIVWAKEPGHAWRPAVVVEVDSHARGIREAAVTFIGKDSHASLPFPKLAKYRCHYQKHALNAEDGVAYSVMVANKLLARKTTFEEETREWMKDESATAKHSKLSIEDNKPFLPNAFEFDKLADPATIKVESEEHRPRKSCPTVSLIKLIKTCSTHVPVSYTHLTLPTICSV